MNTDGTWAKRVLLTRPEGSNEALAQALQEAGFDVQVLPLLAIKPLPESEHNKHLLMNIDLYQHVICTSQHAAHLLTEALDQYWPQLPTGIKWYALGKASATPLQKQGLRVICANPGNTSEDLLAVEDLLTIHQQKVLLAKGEGGRDYLANQLVSRGAKVDALELYQRVATTPDVTRLAELSEHWPPEIIVLLSTETLAQFGTVASHCNAVHKKPDLTQLKVIVPSKRVAEAAVSAGYQAVIAHSAEPQEIMQAILQTLSDR